MNMPWVRFTPKQQDAVPQLVRTLYNYGRSRIQVQGGIVYLFVGQKHMGWFKSLGGGDLRNYAREWRVVESPQRDQEAAIQRQERRQTQRAIVEEVSAIVQTAPALDHTDTPTLPEKQQPLPRRRIRTRGLPQNFWTQGVGLRYMELLDRRLTRPVDIQHSVYLSHNIRPTLSLISVALHEYRQRRGRSMLAQPRVPPYFWREDPGADILRRLHYAEITDLQAMKEVRRHLGTAPTAYTIQGALHDYRQRMGLKVTPEILAKRVLQGMERNRMLKGKDEK